MGATSDWRLGVKIQARVILALMLRESIGHHGHDNLGFFWIIAEPLALMTGITVIWSVTHITHGDGVDVIPFALTGYSFITLWRHITGRAGRAMTRSTLLRYHRQVQFLDTLIARGILETLALFSAFLVAYIPLAMLGFCPIPSDPLILISGFLFTGLFSFGAGLIITSLSELSEAVVNVIPAVMYVALPLTGAFTLQQWLPEHVRRILAWSPLVNCIEMIRGGVFPPEVTTMYDVPFTAVCCFITVSLGLGLIRLAEGHVES